jgi:preprotein translocase subunit SecB
MEKMKKSLLQLENYFFTKIEVNANKRFKGQTKAAPLNPEVKVSIGKNKEEPLKYGVMLQLAIKSSDSEIHPYDINLECIGAISFDKDLMEEIPDKEKEKLKEHVATVNGASILYSAARDFILTLTARGPWRAMVLPTKTFSDLRTKDPTISDPIKDKPVAKAKSKKPAAATKN